MESVVSEGFSLGGEGIGDDGSQCSNCGNRVHARANYCQRCGSAVSGLTRPAYCSTCGESYSEDDEYCASCGKNRPRAEPATDQQAEPSESSRRHESGGETQTSTDSSVDTERQEAFRRHVREYVNDGWELTEDYGDRVVITDRGIGSLPAHAVLLIFTGGLGNLAYGWYSYSAGAETRRLAAADTQSREESQDREIDTEIDKLTAGFVSSTTMFVGLALMLAGTPSAIALGLTLVTVSVGLIPPVRDRLRQRRSLTDFGRHRRVEQRLSKNFENDSQPCIVCGEACDEGVQRRRREETLVFGVPVRIHDSQVNNYCQDCAETEPIGEVDSLNATGWQVASTSASRSIPTSVRIWYSNLVESEDSPSASPPQSILVQESESESESESGFELESDPYPGSESEAEQPSEYRSGSSHQSPVDTGSPSSQKSSRMVDANQHEDERESDSNSNRERSS